MELIDKQALMNSFEKLKKNAENLFDTFYLDGVLATIETQPIAYDVDEVVKQLEELKSEAEHELLGVNSFRIAEKKQRVEGIEDAIEIVKGGKE